MLSDTTDRRHNEERQTTVSRCSELIKKKTCGIWSGKSIYYGINKFITEFNICFDGCHSRRQFYHLLNQIFLSTNCIHDSYFVYLLKRDKYNLCRLWERSKDCKHSNIF